MQLKPTIKVLSLSARNKAATRYRSCLATSELPTDCKKLTFKNNTDKPLNCESEIDNSEHFDFGNFHF
jgi:hypothetical protein